MLKGLALKKSVPVMCVQDFGFYGFGKSIDEQQNWWMVLKKKNRKRRIGEVVVSAREEKERKEKPCDVWAEKNGTTQYPRCRNTNLLTLCQFFPPSIPKIQPTPNLSPNPLNLSPYHSLIQAFRLIQTLL